MAISSTLLARARNLPAPVQGALYMTAAAFAFSWMNIAIRAVSAEMDPLQIAFFRNLFALMFMLPWLASAGLDGLKTERLKHHLLRAAIGMAAMVCWFYSVALLPLAEAVALNFTVPLFATAGAALILGVLIILRPGFAEVTPVTALPVAAALFMAFSVLIVKSLSRSDSPQVVVFYMNLFLTPLSLVPALFVWRWPDGWALLLLVLVGLLATLAHLALTRSYQKADASAVIPFDYARLPFVALFAYFLFGEQPDLWTWVGAGVITASAIYIARREAQVAREREASLAAGRAAEGRP